MPKNLYEEPPEVSEDLSPPAHMDNLRERDEKALNGLFRDRLNWELVRKLEAHEGRVPTDDEVESFCSFHETEDHLQHYYWKNKWLFSIALRLNNTENTASICFNENDPPTKPTE